MKSRVKKRSFLKRNAKTSSLFQKIEGTALVWHSPLLLYLVLRLKPEEIYEGKSLSA